MFAGSLTPFFPPVDEGMPLPWEAFAQSTGNMTYAIPGTETVFPNGTSTWNDSRYWIQNLNGTLSLKDFPYVGDVQPDYPIVWDASTESFVHDDSPPVQQQNPVQPNSTPITPPTITQPTITQPTIPYQPPNYQSPQPFELISAGPAKYPTNIDTETYSIREYVRADDTIVGVHEIFGTPRIVIDGVAESYYVEETNDKIIFRSNSVGGVIYDKNSCSYSIYENGWGSDPIIPAVSIIGRQATVGTDNWVPLNSNSQACSVSVTQGDTVVITSTKGSYGQTQVLNANATGTTTVDRLLDGVEHELIISPETGIKETFRVATTDANQKLGVTQTAHIGNELVIGDTTYNIAELNGLVMDRAMIEAEEAQIFEITAGLNYDIGAGWDRLWAISFEDNGILADNKIMLDYSNNQEVAETFLEIDPTWNLESASGANQGRVYKNNAGATTACGTADGGGSGVGNAELTSRSSGSAGGYCASVWAEFDLTSWSAPDNAIVTGFQYKVDTQINSSYTNNMVVDVNRITSAQPSTVTSHPDLEQLILSGTTVINDSDFVQTDNSYTFDLPNVSPFPDWYALGIHYDPFIRDSNSHQVGLYNQKLAFVYTIPPNYLPPAPTNLATGTIQSSQVNLSWNEMTGGITQEFGLGQELGYKVYKSDYPYAHQNLPANKGGDAITGFTGEVTASEMADNELLFHFDQLEGVEGTTTLDVDNIVAYYEMDAAVSNLDGTVTGAVTTATQTGNWAGDLGSAITVQTGTTPATPTYETDFTSSTGWTSSNTASIEITNNELQFKNNYNRNYMKYDLGSGNISNDKWVLQYKANFGGTASTDDPLFFVALTDFDGHLNTSGDKLGGYFYFDRANTWSRIHGAVVDGSASSGGSGTSPSYYDISKSTDYWVQYTRDGTTFRVDIYDNANYSGTPLSTLTQSSTPATIDNLQYVIASHHQQGSGITGTIDDLKFYNGVTDASDIPVYTDFRAEQYQSGTTTATIMDDDLTTDPGFVYMNSGTTAQHDSGNGEIDIAYSGTSNPAYAYYDLGTPLGDTWSMQFDLRRNSGSNQDFAIGFADDSGWTGTPGDLTSWGSGDWAGVRTVNNCKVTVYEFNDGSSNGSSQGTSCPSIGNWETYTVTYDGSKLTVDVTNNPGTPADYEVSSTGATGLQYLTMSARQPGGVAWGENVSVDNIKICDGTTDPTTCQVPVYSYYNFADLGYAEDTERFVGQEFGSSLDSVVATQSSYNVLTDLESSDKWFGGVGIVNTNSALYGKTLSAVSFWLSKGASPTGNYEVELRDSSGNVRHTFGTGSASALTGSAVKYTFSTPMPSTMTINSGDVIGVTYDNTSWSTGRVSIHYQSSDVYDGTNTIFQRYTGSTWTNQSTVDSAFEVSYQQVTNADLIGTAIDNVKLRLEKVGSPTGTAEVGVWDSSNTKVHDFGNHDMSSVTSSQFTSLTTLDSSNTNGSNGLGGGGGSVSQIGVGIQSGHGVIGKEVTQISMWHSTYGNPSGNGYAQIVDSDGSTVRHTSDGGGASWTPSDNEVPNDNGQTWAKVAYTFSTPIDIEAGDYIMVTGGSYSNNNEVTTKSSNIDEKANEQHCYYQSGMQCTSTRDRAWEYGVDQELTYTDKTFSSSSPYTITAGDKLGMLMDATGSDDDNFVQMYYGTGASTDLTSSDTDIIWDQTNSFGGSFSADGKVFTKTSGSADFTGGGVVSEGCEVGVVDCEFHYYIDQWNVSGSTSHHMYLGIDDSQSLTAGNTIDYNYYANAYIIGGHGWEISGVCNPCDSINHGDVAKIKVDTSGTVTQHINGNLDRTVTNAYAPGTVVYAWVFPYNNGVDIPRAGDYARFFTSTTSNADYDSSLSKMKYGTFGSLEEGIPEVAEQSSTDTRIWDTTTGNNNCAFTSTDHIATSTSSTNWATRCNSVDISDEHHFKLGGGTSDNYRVALVTAGERTTTSGSGGAGASYTLLIEGIYPSTTANLYEYANGASSATSVCGSCIDMTKDMSLTKSGSTWSFKVDGVEKSTYSSSSDFYLQNLVQKASMSVELLDIVTITQPYVPPVTYDLRFQSTLGNAASGAGLLLDGADDYISFGSTGDWNFLHDGTPSSISFWMKKTTPESDDIRHILGTTDGSGNGIEVLYYDRSSSSENRKIKIEISNASLQQTGIYYLQEAFPNDSNWHYYTIAYDLDNEKLDYYVDGVLKTPDSLSFNGSTTSGDSSHTLLFGKRNNNTFYLDASLDEITLYDYQLDYFAVETLYNQGDGRDPSTLQAYIQNNVKPVAYYNLDDGGAVNQHPPDLTVYNVCEDLSGVTCDFSLDPSTPTTYETDFTTSTGWTTNSDFTIDTATDEKLEFTETRNNHVAYYDLGSSYTDGDFVLRWEMNLSSFNSNNGGAPMTFVTLSDNTSGTTTTHDALIAFNYGGNGWRQSTADGVRSDSTSNQTGDLGSITAGQTDYMEINRSGSFYTLSRYTDSTYTTTDFSNSLSIGSGITGLQYIKIQNGYQGNKDGWIDNVKFYNGVTNGINHSILHDGTPNGISLADGVVGKALDFDGNDDYVKIDDFSFVTGQPFSISGWVHFTTVDTGTSHQTIFRQASGSSYASPYHDIFAYQYNDKIQLTVNDGSTYQSLTGATSITNTQWHHVTITYNGSGEYIMYLDGVNDGTFQHTTTFSTQPLYFGLSDNGGTLERELNGKLDEWYIFYDKVLTEAEVTAVYNAGLAGNQLSSAIVSTSGAGTYLIDESGVHDAVYSIKSSIVTVPQTQNFEDPANWSSTGSSITVDSAYASKIGSTSTTGNDRIWKEIGTVSDDWTMTFDMYHTGNNNNMYIRLTDTPDEDTWSSGSRNSFQFTQQDNGSTYYGILAHASGGSESQCDTSGMTMTRGTTYSTTVTKSGTSLTASNSAGSLSCSNVPSHTGLNYLQVGADGGGGNYWFDTVVISDVTYSSSQSPTFEAGKVGTQALVSPQVQVTSKAVVETGAVTIASNAFSPTPLSIPTGSTVTWSNTDNTIHQVKSTPVPSITTYMDTLSETLGSDLHLSGSTTMRGEKAETSSSALIGATAQKVTFKLKAVGSPTGTATVKVVSDGGTLRETVGTLDVSTVASTYTDYTFENPTASYTMVENDQIVIHYSGSSSNYISAVRINSDVFDGSNSVRSYHDGSWVFDSGTDMVMKVESCSANCGAIVTLDSGNISAGGGTFSHTFDTEGTYNYECPIHSGMTGQIVVADSYSMPSGTEDFTVSAWTKTTQGTPNVVFNNDYGSGWVNNNLGTPYGVVSTTANSIDIAVDNTSTSNYPHNSMNYELSSALSDEWVMRYSFTVDDKTSTMGNAYFNVMLTDDMWLGGGWDAQNENNGNGDFISAMYHVSSADNKWGTASADNFTHGQDTSKTGITYTVGTTYYFELIRTSPTAFQVDYHGTSGFGTAQDSLSRSIASTIADLDTIAIGMPNQNGMGSWDISVNDIQVCDGQTDWANCVTVGADEIGTVLSFETQEAPTVTRDSTYDGTNNGATTQATGKIDSYAWDFDDDYVQTPSKFDFLHDGSGGSISYWVKFDSLGSDAYIDSTGGSSTDTGFYVRNNNNLIRFAVLQSGNTWSSLDTSTSVSTGQWYHVVHTFDTVQKTYLDGALDNTKTPSSPKTGSATNNLRIGSGHGANGMDGVLDQFVIYDKVLSASDVTALYNSGSGTTTPSTTNLIAHYDFEQTGSTLENQLTVSTPAPTKTTAFEVEPTKMRIVDITPPTTASIVQGNAGAAGDSSGAGGGGGAGSAGTGKHGGDGIQSDISGSNQWYAGGGGAAYDGSNAAGSGGQGGGGNGGSNNQNSSCGTNGTGGGAGGGGNVGGNCGDGGSGVVIVSYPTADLTATGGTITTSGSNTIHTFASGSTSGTTGTLTVSSGSTSNARLLIVAGGGGSMENWGHSGGAGAGGLIELSTYGLSSGSYAVVVGEGGQNGGGSGMPSSGGDSSFGTIVAVGGGYGGNWYSGSTNIGGNGGSAGGGQTGYAGGEGTTSTIQTNGEVRTNILEQTVSLTPNDWKHVSWVRDGSSWKSIVDGSQVGSTVTQSTSLGTISSQLVFQNIGTLTYTADKDHYSNGYNTNCLDSYYSNNYGNNDGEIEISPHSNASCRSGWIEFEAPTSTVTRATLTYDVVSTGSNTDSCTWVDLRANKPSTSSGSTIFSDFGNSSYDIMTGDTDCETVGTDKEIDVTSYVNDAVTNGRDWFAVGAFFDGYRTGHYPSSYGGWTANNFRVDLASQVEQPPTYHIGTQPDGATNPLAVIDELHVHADAEETVVEKSYDRGSATFQQVGANVPFTTEGAQKTFADTSVSPGDAPIYKISSYNLLGETELQALVQGLTVQLANAPTNLAASSTVNADIQLSWTASTDLGGGTLLDYELQRRTPPTTGTWITVSNPTTTSYLDTNVNTGTTYEYQVATNNEAGTGAYSSPVSQQAGIPPDPPTITSVTIPNPNTQPHDHFIEWTAPSNLGTAGSLTHYGIYYHDGTGWQTANANIGIPSPLEWTFSAPTPFQVNQLYQYKMVAVSAHGTSNDSNIGSVTTPNVPDQVSPAPGVAIEDPDAFPLKIKVSWTTPGDGGSIIKGYQIERWDVINGWTVHVANTAVTDITYEDTLNVLQDTEYKYKVAAINTMGTGLPSLESPAITTPRVPDAPTNPTSAINDIVNAPMVVTLGWTAPANDGGSALTGYNIYEQIAGAGWSATPIATVGPTVTTYDHTTTQTNTLHEYRFTATNNVGESAFSTTTSVTTPSEPSQPTGLTVTPIDHDTLQLDWTAPTTAANGGQLSPVTGYKIEFETPPGNGYVILEADTSPDTSVTYTHNGLTGGVEYQYQVYAINLAGTSLSSTAALGLTMPGAPTNLVITQPASSGIELDLTWTAPANNVASYKIERESPIGGGWSVVVADTLSSVTAYTDDNNGAGLSTATLYNYRVSGINQSGTGPTSNEDDGTTLADAPSNLTTSYTYTAPNEIDLSWTAPSGAITGYQIERADAQVPGVWTAIVTDTGNVNTTYKDSDNIQLSNSYAYRIYAWTAGGLSPMVSNTASQVTVSAPDPPTNLVVGPYSEIGSNQRIMKLEWVAPSNTGLGGSEVPIIGYKIERNISGAGWLTWVPDTQNAVNSALNYNLADNEIYEYRVSTITVVGTSGPSNTVNAEFVVMNQAPTAQAIAGKTVGITPIVTIDNGIDTPEIYRISLYVDEGQTGVWKFDRDYTVDALQSACNSTMELPKDIAKSASFSFCPMFTQVNGASDFYFLMYATQDNGLVDDDNTFRVTQSPTVSITPLAIFEGNVQGVEKRAQNCTDFDNSVCPLDYDESTVNINADSGDPYDPYFNMTLRYQHQDLKKDPEVRSYYNVLNVTDSWGGYSPEVPSNEPGIEDETTYYISVYVNPGAKCAINPDSGEQADCFDMVAADTNDSIPAAYPADLTLISRKSPDAQPQLGIEPMGNLFGMPMVFMFIIGLAAVFTGRSAQMGGIIIAMVIGVMWYLGYLDFSQLDGTWIMIIVAAIVGLFIGKRWS